MSFKRIRYRFRQFFTMFLGAFQPVDTAYAKVQLASDSLFALFESLPRMEQNHGIAICKTLEKRGKHSPDLLVAALLHDVGKVEHVPTLCERVLTVLVEHFTPKLARRFAHGQPTGLKRGFVIRRVHADLGADLVREAGASSRVVDLIRRHHKLPGDDCDLIALQAFDDG